MNLIHPRHEYKKAIKVLFENFVKNEFNNIANKYELKNRCADTKTTVEYTAEGFNEDFKRYYEILTKQTKNGKPQTTKEFYGKRD